jgi:NUBPL iron-transfer P-loop NTPase
MNLFPLSMKYLCFLVHEFSQSKLSPLVLPEWGSGKRSRERGGNHERTHGRQGCFAAVRTAMLCMALFPRFLLILIVLDNSLKGTDWGDLDVLVLDLPPGTGDVQLAVLQQLQLSGAVAVTTPSKLAITDTKKGVEMFTSLGVPTLAVVENLSFFAVCPSVAWSLSSVSISTLDVLTVFLTCYA